MSFSTAPQAMMPSIVFGRFPSPHQPPLLRRPAAPPSLDEFWEAPPRFRQPAGRRRFWHRRGARKRKREIRWREQNGAIPSSADEAGNDGEVEADCARGVNARWRFDLCLYKRAGFLRLPALLAYGHACVRHAWLHVRAFGAVCIRIPLVDISFIELELLSDDFDASSNAGNAATGRLHVRGRGLFRMLIWLSACKAGDLFAIRDWLRFLIVRQRIPHLVLGLQFSWAKAAQRRAQRKYRRAMVAKAVAQLAATSRAQIRKLFGEILAC